MATRYISIDSGKFATKVSSYDFKDKTVRSFPIRTKVSEGDFRDDAIEENTVVIEIDGKVYKVGNGARGSGAALDTDKKSDIHRICAITSIAAIASANEVDEINVVVGLPAKEWASVSKREAFKEYILPTGEVEISIRTNSKTPVVKKKFIIKNKFAAPESSGALYVDEVIDSVSPTSITAILDTGNLNLNATLWQGTELLQDKSITAELGGAILIQELAQEISTNIVPCDELIAANILKDHSGDRHLPENLNLSKEQIDLSKTVINKVITDHVEKIKRICRARNWSLDLMNIIAIGGTSQDIAEELKKSFKNITVLDNPTFVNSLGYLRWMCAKLPDFKDEVIPLTLYKKSAKEA